jgi:hypothetical protein
MARRRSSPAMTAKRRGKLSKSRFGLPGQRKYPMDTPGRAANAKARATQQFKRGRIPKGTRDRIHAKANRILKRAGRKSGGRRKRR